MIKIIGYLPHPNKKGFYVGDPYLLVTPTVQKSSIKLSIEAYLSTDDIDNNNRIAGETYNDFDPIPFHIYNAISIADSSIKHTFKSFETISEHRTIDAELTMVSSTFGVSIDNKKILIREVYNDIDNEYYTIDKVDIRQADNNANNVVDKLLLFCHQAVINKLTSLYSDKVNEGSLTFEIIL